jgi:hypothetical protein
MLLFVLQTEQDAANEGRQAAAGMKELRNRVCLQLNVPSV